MPELASTNRVALAKVRESTFGIIPANPAFAAIRQTSSSLAANPQTVVSEEIRSDRQVSDLILVGMDSGGGVGGELSFGAADDDFEEALQGTWANRPTIVNVTADTEISDVSTTALTVSAGGAAFKTGHLALMSGFATAGNNKLARVASATGTAITFPAATFTAEGDVPLGARVRVVGFQGASGDVTAVTAGGNGLGSTALDFTTLGLSAGDWIWVGGAAAGERFATGACNGWCRVSAVAAQKLSLDRVPTGWVADTGTAKTVQVFMGDRVVNGTTKRSSTIERRFLDHSPVTYEYFLGMTLDRLQLNIERQRIVTFEKTYIGRSAVVGNARQAGATDIAASAGSVLNASSHVGRLGYAGQPLTGPNFVMGAEIAIANNLRRQTAVGDMGAVGIGNGEFSVTGTLNTYFGDKSVYDAVIGNTETSFDIVLGRPDGNREAYLIDLPRLKLSSGSPSVSGKNQDVPLNAGFQAIAHGALGYTMAVHRFHYLPA